MVVVAIPHQVGEMVWRLRLRNEDVIYRVSGGWLIITVTQMQNTLRYGLAEPLDYVMDCL